MKITFVKQTAGAKLLVAGFNENAEFGNVRPNSFTIGVRYMLSPKFGFKFDSSMPCVLKLWAAL